MRTEGTVDPRSRVVYAVAQVQDPYRQAAGSAHPPLQMGMFVKAEIKGKTIENAFVLPRQALRNNNQILIVEANSTLVARNVEVIRMERENVIIGAGINDGDSICLTALEFVVGGMKVTAQMKEEEQFEEEPTFEEKMVSAKNPEGGEEI